MLINKRHVRYPALISLDRIAALHEILETPDAWHIGASARLTDVEAALKGKYPALDSMFRWFASRQIRHRATLGGNLVTASPIGDSAPVLLALDASVVLVSHEGERIVRLSEFFTGYRKTVMAENELMKAILIPHEVPGRTDFFKVSRRREMDISIVSAAIRTVLDDHGVVIQARLAFGGVAATPMRALKAEAALIGRKLEIDEAFLDLLESEFTPLSDVRSGAAYRKQVIRGLFAKHLEPPVLNDESWSSEFHSGHGVPHESAVGHVTGAARFVNDVAMKRGMLSVWPVVSKQAHARINRIDISAALTMPGVRTVLLAKDIPGHNNVGPVRHDEPLFADDEILFRSQMIAAVIGNSQEACRLAAETIIIETEPLPLILGLDAAIAADSFHTDPHVLARGEIVGGQEHFYLETQAAWAEPDGEGGMIVHSSTQHPSEIQTIVAEVLGCTKHRVVVESPRMGGGFGGKETQGNAWAALCALAASITGEPVAIQLDRDLDMEITGKRHPFHARYKVGYDESGKLLAADVFLVSDGGWSLDLSQPVTDRALFHLDNAYYIPHVRFEGRVAKTHITSQTAFRGFGGPQGMLVIEEIIGRIALKLGLPPEEVRARNFYHGSGETNTTHYGEDIGDNRLARIWNELLESSD
ncbi:MAG: xanthine dehydrogenase, partial [Verrucomicrobiales bacterium VVV1]